jgi:hypothetical protein
MKIYTKIVIDIETGRVEETECFDYDGPISMCGKKGGGGGSSIDYAYNQRMADIAEELSRQGSEYFQFWQDTYKPYEESMIQANMGLVGVEVEAKREELILEAEKYRAAGQALPAQLEAELAALEQATSTSQYSTKLNPYLFDAAKEETLLGEEEAEAKRSLLPLETDYRRGLLQSEAQLRPLKTGMASKFYKEALQGVDVESRMDTASADVAHSFKDATAGNLRTARRLGLNPNDPRTLSMLQTSGLDMARGIATARTTARTGAETENFDRLLAGMQYQSQSGLPKLNF